jgi:hypothetical protein
MIEIRMRNAGLRDSLLAKSERAIHLAKLMLGGDASMQDVEDQAVALMFLPSDEMATMQERWLRHDPRCSR